MENADKSPLSSISYRTMGASLVNYGGSRSDGAKFSKTLFNAMESERGKHLGNGRPVSAL